MQFVNTTAHHQKLNELVNSADPRTSLCDWINRLSTDEKVRFLRLTAGWQGAEYFRYHTFSTTNDPEFEELMDSVLPNVPKPDSPS